MSEIQQNLPPARSMKTFYLLIAVFILPFTMAVLLHLFDYKSNSKHYGALVQPPQRLQIPILKDFQGNTFKPAQWEKIWNIVTVDSTGCAKPCAARLHMLKQVHTSINKDIDRVQRVLLVPADAGSEAYSEIQKKYPDLIILAGSDAASVKFAAEFDVKKGNVFLVDPKGHLMMTYPSEMNPKGMQVDLKKLLKNSWAG